MNAPYFFRFLALCWCFLNLLGSAGAQQNFITATGRITSPTGAPCGNVMVIATGPTSDVTLTNADGWYSLKVLPNAAYQITPFSNGNPLNGVTTLDVALTHKHVTGVELFSSPYKILAADADDNGAVTLADTTLMRSVILGFTQAFPGGGSCRFVPKNHVFADPQNPFPYPRAVNTGVLTANTDGFDFYAIKIGDVNYTAIMTDLSSNSGAPLFPSYIGGRLAFDQNDNCLADPAEPPLEGWIAIADGANGTYYALSQAGGIYQIYVPAGAYTVTLYPPNELWTVCQNQIPVSIGMTDTVQVDFAAQSQLTCPRLRVDLATPFLRRCFDNYCDVNWCNTGTVEAENAYVEVQLDSFMQVLSASQPWTAQNGNTYTFALGNIAAGDCGTLRIFFNLSCDAVLGQTHCSEAHIFPDTLCGPVAWTGPRLEVDGHCENGSAVFTVTNTGGAMDQTAEYVVLEDVIVQMTGGNVLLGSGQSHTIELPANGSTWRVEVDQAPGYPGTPLVSAALEGCGTRPDGSFSMGIVPLFPAYTASESIDVDCQVNRGAYDPNDKQGFPVGVGAEHYIPKNTPIEYLIRFQNTGTDTAFFVKILDTLSASLDLRTLRMLGASHPYFYQLLPNHVLQFAFPNIMLPDSNINEAASHGYVRFAIEPLVDLPNETVIFNRAGIYFDFNPPVITNQTWHTVGERYLKIAGVQASAVALDVFPNPSHTTAVFSLKSPQTHRGRLQIFDARGVLQREQPFGVNLFDVDVSGLSAGFYAFRLMSDNGRLLATGKLTVGHP